LGWNEWRPYVSVHARRAQAKREMASLRKQGVEVQPVAVEGRKMAHTFWGEAWCDHLEQFSDYANRLPRGRTYVRNGSVCHLGIAAGVVEALVSGSELYQVRVEIGKLPAKKWGHVKGQCAGRIGSLLELLQGRLSDQVMAVVCDRDRGLFPHPREITLQCSCPDWAVMCKHVAAVLYGVGARLDEQPELLFLLRGVDHVELIGAEADLAATVAGGKAAGERRIAEEDLSDVFGIEMAEGDRPDDVVAAVAGAQAVTGRQVAGLRRKLDLSQRELGLLLGVSGVTVGNWERRPGPLPLQASTRQVWEGAAQLTREEAWMWLEVLTE